VNGVEETYEAGDAFYVRDAHTQTAIAGSEMVQFNPRMSWPRRKR
jgi:hypothetical protein